MYVLSVFPETGGNIRRKIIVMGILLALAPVMTLLGAAWIVIARVNQVGGWDRARDSSASLPNLTRSLLEICRSYQASVDARLKSGLAILNRAGPISLDPNRPIVWHAQNALTGEVSTISLPVMLAGGVQFLPVADFNQAAPIVDDIDRSGNGMLATVFERMNESGDMLRVSSTEKNDKGLRATGSYLPALSPDGLPNAPLKALLAGDRYLGAMFVGKTPYLAAYEPLKDQSGAVVGMLYTAISEDEITAKLRQLTAWAHNANYEQVFVLRAEGDERGTALIMGDKALEDHNLWAEKDSAGQPYVQEICTRARALPPGETATYKYQKKTRVGAIPRTVTAQFAYIPEWHWVVGLAQPEADFLASSQWTMWALLALGLAGTGLVVRIWVKYSSDLTAAFAALLDDFARKSKEIAAAAAAISHEVEIAKLAPVAAPPGHIHATAGRTAEEINLAIRHIDASNDAVSSVIEAIEQIAFATNILAVNSALEASQPKRAHQEIASIAEELRNLAQRCGDAALETRAAIEQSRVELQKGNFEVAKLLLHLRPTPRPAPSALQQPPTPLQRETENLLQATQAISQTLERVYRTLPRDRR